MTVTVDLKGFIAWTVLAFLSGLATGFLLSALHDAWLLHTGAIVKRK